MACAHANLGGLGLDIDETCAFDTPLHFSADVEWTVKGFAELGEHILPVEDRVFGHKIVDSYEVVVWGAKK